MVETSCSQINLRGEGVGQEICGCKFKGSVLCQEKIMNGETISFYAADRSIFLPSIVQGPLQGASRDRAAGLCSTVRRSAIARKAILQEWKWIYTS